MNETALLIAAGVAYWAYLGFLCWHFGLWPFKRELPSHDAGPAVAPAEWEFPPKWHPPAEEYVSPRERVR